MSRLFAIAACGLALAACSIVGRRDEDGNANRPSAIRIRTGGRRGENVKRADLQDALRSRGAGNRFHGDLRHERLKSQNVPVQADTGRRSARRHGIPDWRFAAALFLPNPVLRRIGKSQTQGRRACEEEKPARCDQSVRRALRRRWTTRRRRALRHRRRLRLRRGRPRPIRSADTIKPSALPGGRFGLADGRCLTGLPAARTSRACCRRSYGPGA